jgi:hypothetical protein
LVEPVVRTCAYDLKPAPSFLRRGIVILMGRGDNRRSLKTRSRREAGAARSNAPPSIELLETPNTDAVGRASAEAIDAVPLRTPGVAKVFSDDILSEHGSLGLVANKENEGARGADGRAQGRYP